MDVIAGVIELKPNMMKEVESWSRTINARIDEAIKTLLDEGVQVESWFHLSLEGKDYLLAYIRGKCLEEAAEVVNQSKHDIDMFHNEFKKKAWLKSTKAQLLIDLVNDKA